MNTRILILLFQCRDRKGIVAKISDFIFRHGGNIITADQYSTDPQAGHFFMRVEFQVKDSPCTVASLERALASIAKRFRAQYKIYDRDKRLRMGIMVSAADHCLMDLLYLWRSGELRADIPFVLSNYPRHQEIVEQFNLPFYFIPAHKRDRREKDILSIVCPDSDFLVLARYMLVLSPNFLKKYGKDIINIHHGFLPSFKGADPYRQALEKGVKVIGATAHFVDNKLDAGPIISQEVEYVSHKDDLSSLIRKGRNLEKQALADAVFSYIQRRVIRYANKTIVF